MPIHTDTVMERVRQYGLNSASPVDLVAIALSRREEDANLAVPQAAKLLRQYKTLASLLRAPEGELRDFAGLDEFEFQRFRAALEIGRRAKGQDEEQTYEVANDPGYIVHLLSFLLTEKQEHFYVVFLDAKLKVMTWKPVHIGTLTMSIVGPREVFRAAVQAGASSIIVAHNHPSGDPEPSPEDIDVTGKLVEIGNLLDIPVLDHVILGSRDKWVSLHERGVIK